jgi:isocitrate dehydrogenase
VVQKLLFSEVSSRYLINLLYHFIEGDGTGRDIWKSSVKVIDAAVEKAYKGKKANPLERSTCR